LIPDAELVLQEAGRRAHLALITNGLATVQRSRLAKSGLADRFAQLLSTLSLAELPDPAGLSTCYLVNLGDCTHLIPDAALVLQEAGRRAHLALITNGLATVQRSRLAMSGLADYFEAVIISEEIGVAKPDPRYFDVAFEQMGHPSKDTVLVIGDSLTSDMRGANLYGVDACWFNPEGRPCDPGIDIRYEISTLHDLLDLIAEA
ncbi:MAG: HAD-IA family hydrolase, partial [Anaerolineae bacterium]|nr:HAD-IA family hydrolase [Anaerolineae bacterium]